MRKTTHIPTRTCLGCRTKKPKAELARFVSKNKTVVVDIEQTLPGRGAYTCYAKSCFLVAVKKHSFVRALKTEVNIDPQQLLLELEKCLKKS